MERIVSYSAPAERYQVRFWAHREVYQYFTEACDRRGLSYGSTFEAFMTWFVDQPDPAPKENS